LKESENSSLIMIEKEFFYCFDDTEIMAFRIHFERSQA
jgi:hypothetical protein